jgi:hypothetical protein
MIGKRTDICILQSSRTPIKPCKEEVIGLGHPRLHFFGRFESVIILRECVATDGRTSPAPHKVPGMVDADVNSLPLRLHLR